MAPKSGKSTAKRPAKEAPPVEPIAKKQKRGNESNNTPGEDAPVLKTPAPSPASKPASKPAPRRLKRPAPKEQNTQPLLSQDPSDRRQLLPYIATGWTPVATKSDDSECGLFALTRGYREMGMMTQKNTISNVTCTTVKKMIRDKGWSAAVKKSVTSWKQDSPEEYLTGFIKELVKQRNWFDDDFLIMLLGVLNEKYETSFRLGIVRHGLGEERTNARVYSTNETAAGPIIWLHNHGEGSAQHWSAFAPYPYTNGRYSQGTIGYWALDQDVKALVETGNLYRIKSLPDKLEVLAFVEVPSV